MSPEKKEKYIKDREKVRFLYYCTDCTVQQAADHVGISWGKANKMVTAKGEPIWFQLEYSINEKGEIIVEN